MIEKNLNTSNDMLKNAEKAWNRSMKTNGKETIDHKRLYLSKRNHCCIKEEFDIKKSELTRYVHICILHANQFSMLNRLNQCKDTMGLLTKEHEEKVLNGETDTTATSKEINELAKELKKLKDEYHNSEMKLNNVIYQLTVEDYLCLAQSSNNETVGDKIDEQREEDVLPTNVIIHKGGRSQIGGYDMGIRYQNINNRNSRILPSLTSSSCPSISNIQYAPLWPGTSHTDILKDNNKINTNKKEVVVDFGLILPGKKVEKEIVFENCADINMTVLIDCSSSLFEFTNHFTITPNNKQILSICLQSDLLSSGGSINQLMYVTSSLSELQKIHLIGHIGFPITMNVPDTITLPPTSIKETKQNEKEMERDDSTTYNLPFINHSRYTLVMYLSGLENSNFITIPSCSGEHRRKNMVALSPLSVSCITLKHVIPTNQSYEKTGGLSYLMNTFGIEIAHPFQWKKLLSKITIKSFSTSKLTCSKEIQLINRWYHNEIVLQLPRKNQIPIPINVTDDMKWVATIDHFYKNKYVLHFISDIVADTNTSDNHSINSKSLLKKEFKLQHGFDLNDFRVTENKGSRPLIVGIAVVTSIIGNLYNVQMVKDGIIMEHVQRDRLAEIYSKDDELGMEEEKKEEGKENMEEINDIKVGQRVHVLIPKGTQVMSIPKFYKQGVLMKLSNKLMNVKLKDDGNTSSIMCRDIPIDWLWLGEREEVPTIGSTVYIHYHPPNNIPNMTVPWLFNMYRKEQMTGVKNTTEVDTMLPPSLNLLYLNKKNQKLKRNSLVYYHDDQLSEKVLIIKNIGFTDISINVVISSGYIWKKENEEWMRDDDNSEICSNGMNIGIQRENFIKLNIKWLNKNLKLPIDKGWLCVINAKNPIDTSIVSIIGTCNALPLVDIICSSSPSSSSSVEDSTPIQTLNVPIAAPKKLSVGHIKVRNRTSKDLQLDTILEQGPEPFIFTNNTTSNSNNNENKQRLMIGPYDYTIISIQFQPKMKGIYRKKIKILSSTTLGDPSERDGHHIVEIIGLCSLPVLDGLPTSINFGNMIEGKCRYSTLSITNNNISTTTITTSVDQPYYIKPSFCILETNKNKIMKILYRPLVNGRSTSSLNIAYGNGRVNKNKKITAVGTCGTCLVHSSVIGNTINFGNNSSMKHKKTCHVFLTNIGTLILRMKRMSIVDVKHFDIRFVGIVPKHASHTKMTIQNDKWNIIRSNWKRALKNEKNLKKESDYYFNKELEMVQDNIRRSTKRTFKKNKKDFFNDDEDYNTLISLSVDEKIKFWTQDEEEMYESLHTSSSLPSSNGRRRRSICVQHEDEHDIGIRAMPPLHSDWSWHFQITFIGNHRHSLREHISFEFEPWQTEEIDQLIQRGILIDGNISSNNTSNDNQENVVTMTLRGQRSPGVIVQPPMVHFGNVPASILFHEDTDIVTSEKRITFTNTSLKNQTMKVISCSSDAVIVLNSVNGDRMYSWTMTPGEQMDIVLAFTPETPHVLYHSEILFGNISQYENEDDNIKKKKKKNSSEYNDVLVVNARGYGACSELIIEDQDGLNKRGYQSVHLLRTIQYGLRSIGSINKKTFQVVNNGLLKCNYQVEIYDWNGNKDSSCISSHYYIEGSVHGIYRGCIDGKSSQSITVVYDLTQHIVDTTTTENTAATTNNKKNKYDKKFNGQIQLKWSKVETGGEIIVDNSMNISGGIGYVDVRLEKKSLDYGTMFVKQYKTKKITIKNYGNTSTTLNITNHNSNNEKFLIHVLPMDNIVLEPNTSSFIEVKIKPLCVELLRSSINITVNGKKEVLELLLIGTVAAPHLVVPTMNFDYGVLRANTSKQTFTEIKNSGNFVVSYEMLLIGGSTTTAAVKSSGDSENDDDRNNDDRNNDGNNNDDEYHDINTTTEYNGYKIFRENDNLTIGCISVSPSYGKVHPGQKIRMLVRVVPMNVGSVEHINFVIKSSDGAIHEGYIKVIGGGASIVLLEGDNSNKSKIGRHHDLGMILVNNEYTMQDENDCEKKEYTENQADENKKQKPNGIYIRNIGNMPTMFQWKVEDILCEQEDMYETTEKKVVNGRVVTKSFKKRTELKNTNINIDVMFQSYCIHPGKDVFVPLKLLIKNRSINQFSFIINKDHTHNSDQSKIILDIDEDT